MVAGSVAAEDSALIEANASMDSLELKVAEEELEKELQKAGSVISIAKRRAAESKASVDEQITASKEALQKIQSRHISGISTCLPVQELA